MIEKGENSMKFSQPLVLFLGSVLSASGIGCSAITAVVSDSSPANREHRDDADRLAAIARVFENQGRYDKAEVLYGKALKNRPQDAELRKHLQQLAERRKEKKFGPTETANAIARADIVSPPKSGVQRHQSKFRQLCSSLRHSPLRWGRYLWSRFLRASQLQLQKSS